MHRSWRTRAAAAALPFVLVAAAGCGGDADGRAAEADGAAGYGIAGPRSGGQAALVDDEQGGVQDEVVPGEHETGTVRTWNGRYGWVTRDLGGELFMHRAHVFFDPADGDRVWFDVVDGPKGPEARNVVAGDY